MSETPTTTNRSGRLPATVPPEVLPRLSSRGLLGELEHRGDVFRDLGPNWYTSIMGTGIVANAAVLLPVHESALHSLALGVWMLAATLLISLTVATAVHWLRHPGSLAGITATPRWRRSTAPRPWRC